MTPQPYREPGEVERDHKDVHMCSRCDRRFPEDCKCLTMCEIEEGRIRADRVLNFVTVLVVLTVIMSIVILAMVMPAPGR